MKATIWIARDLFGNGLHLFEKEPRLAVDGGRYIAPSKFVGDKYIDGYIELDSDSHPEITFENSPQLIEI